jgi:DNA-binding MurR/RpiR family transcriptional regulator
LKKEEVNFFDRVKEKSNSLSPKQAQLAKYLLENYKKVAFQNLTQIAKDADVSESTVFRLANFLNYPGFPEMLEDLKKIVQYELVAYKSIRNTFKGEQLQKLNILETVVNNHQISLDKMLKNITLEDIKKVVDAIEQSNQIIVIGFYFSGYLAQYLGYTLSKVKSNVRIFNKDSIELNNLFLSCDENTTVFMFAFPRYSKKIQQIGEMLQKKRTTNIGITDSILSPLKTFSNQLLVIPIHYISFTEPCCPVLLLLQAIVMEYVSRNTKNVEENLKIFDEYVEQAGIFK